MAKKIKIKENVVNWSGYELDGKLLDTIVKLQNLIADNPNLFDFEIEIESESGYYNSCSTNINISAFRWETDKEFADRVLETKTRAEREKAAAKQKAEYEAIKERQLYESLKKKFEKEINEGL